MRGPEGNTPQQRQPGEVGEADIVLRSRIEPDPAKTPIGVTIVDEIIFTTKESLDAYMASQADKEQGSET
jgi:hypothetical protein